MNKLFHKVKLPPFRNKKLYLFLLLIFIIGVIFGSIFITILDEKDKASVLNQIGNFFSQIKSGKINFITVFKNSVTANLIYIALVFILGISIIGIPIVIIMLFLKGFMLGFSVASIIAKYKIIGLLGAITYVFPHIILSVIVIFVISYYALKISYSIFKAVIEKKAINFSEIINRYSVIMLIGVIVMVISSLIESFISPYIMKLFTIFI
jgi:stage II sporulation protein M